MPPTKTGKLSNAVKGFANNRADLKSPRPVPLALGRPDAQLKAAIGIIPVEGRLHSRGQLPHQVGTPLPVLQRLAAVVEQHVPGSNGDHLHTTITLNKLLF